MAPFTFIVQTKLDAKDARQHGLRLSAIKQHAMRVFHSGGKRKRGYSTAPLYRLDNRAARMELKTEFQREAIVEIEEPQSPSIEERLTSFRRRTDAKALSSVVEILLTAEGDDERPERTQPWQWSKGARVDPFNCISWCHETPEELDVIMRFIRGRSAFPIMPTNVRDTFYARHGGWIVKLMSRYEEYFHILAATALASHEVLCRQKSRPSSRVQWHKIMAISLLRKRLAKASAVVDEGAIVTVQFLCHHEMSLHNLEAAGIHRKQVGEMVYARGGLNGLGSNDALRAMLEVAYQYGTAEDLRTPTAARPPVLHCLD